MTFISITPDMKAYMVKPEGNNHPCVIVAQEIFGVNDVMRHTCDWLAEHGYMAICPDLFWRLSPGIELQDKTDVDMQKAFRLFGRFDIDTGLDDLMQTVSFARNHPDSNGQVAVVGYCLGGLLAYLMACRSDVDACVGYYGVRIDEFLSEAHNIKKPFLLHIAGKDEFVPVDKQDIVRDNFKEIDMIQTYDYPDMPHAFARWQGIHYHQPAAQLANQRTVSFLQHNIKNEFLT